MMSIRIRLQFFCLALLVFAAGTVYGAEQISIKILAVNPSKVNTLKTDVTHYLPPEVQPDNVLDNAGMELKFDNEKKSYFLSKQIELGPSETQTIVVRIQDVWVIPDEEISGLREKLEKDLQSLKGTKYYQTAELLYQKAADRLGQIEEEKTRPLGIRQKIELYRAHKQQLSEMQTGILSLDSVRKLQASQTGESRTVQFMVTAENPSPEPKKMTIRAELPQDIKNDDIVDRQDFVLLFDEPKQRYIIEKQDDFTGSEKKTYKITLKDIWYIPQTDLDFIKEQTEKLGSHFQGTSYESYAAQGFEFILKNIEQIELSQQELAGSDSIDARMRGFVLNEQRLKLAKRKLKELQDLLLELPLEKQSDSLLQKVVRGVMEIQKVADVSKILSMGVDPDISTTWWLIFGIIIFLAILSLMFYLTWLKKVNQAEKLKKASASAPQPETGQTKAG